MIIVNDELSTQIGGTKEDDEAIALVYKQLTDRTEKSLEVINRLTDEICDYLRKKSMQMLNTLLEPGTGSYGDNFDYINDILEDWDREEVNFIGRINVVTFQLILLFSYILQETKGDEYTSNTEPFILVKLDELRSIYLDYISVREHLKSLKDSTAYGDICFSALWNPLPENPTAIFIIYGLSYLKIDDLLDQMMDSTFFLGLSFEFARADSKKMSPLSFLVHDIVHGINYLRRANEASVDISQLKSFYEFLKANKERFSKKPEDKYSKFNQIRFIFFLLVHETDVNFFISPRGSLPMPEYVIRNGLGVYFRPPYEQFINENDLGLLMPKIIRDMPYSPSKRKAVSEYIFESVKSYVIELTKWHSSNQRAGRRKRRRTRNKRKGLRRKTRKNK
jgi:hypothetical protein